MIFRKAILIIHGFAGGTYDEEPLFFKLQRNLEFDVYNFTLPGHSTNLSADVKYIDWIKAVDEKIEYLNNVGYKKIYIIGHSMGGVLATHAAIHYKSVKKLVLVAPAFEFLSLEKENSFVKMLKNGPEIIKTYHVKEVFSRFLKVSFSQFKEFEKLINMSKDNPEKITVPTLVIQGLSDQLVPYESSKKVFESMNCNKWLIEIDEVTHDAFCGVKVDKICEEINKFLKSHKYSAERTRKW